MDSICSCIDLLAKFVKINQVTNMVDIWISHISSQIIIFIIPIGSAFVDMAEPAETPQKKTVV